jgi:hypothetical protein
MGKFLSKISKGDNSLYRDREGYKNRKGSKITTSSSVRNLRLKSQKSKNSKNARSVEMSKSSKESKSRLKNGSNLASRKNSHAMSSRDTSRDRKIISDFELKIDQTQGRKFNKLKIQG